MEEDLAEEGKKGEDKSGVTGLKTAERERAFCLPNKDGRRKETSPPQGKRKREEKEVFSLLICGAQRGGGGEDEGFPIPWKGGPEIERSNLREESGRVLR